MTTVHDAPAPAAASGPLRWLAWPATLLALLLLNASLTFTNVWPTPRIRWDWALSLELALLVLVMALAPRRAFRLAGAVLPGLWIVLIVGRYLAVTGPGLYGREFNIYWDAPHLGNVIAMLARAVPGWMIAASLLGAIAALAAAFVLPAWRYDRSLRSRPRAARASSWRRWPSRWSSRSRCSRATPLEPTPGCGSPTR